MNKAAMPGMPAPASTAGSTGMTGTTGMPGMSESATKYVAINPNYATPEKSGLSTSVQGESHTYDVDLK